MRIITNKMKKMKEEERRNRETSETHGTPNRFPIGVMRSTVKRRADAHSIATGPSWKCLPSDAIPSASRATDDVNASRCSMTKREYAT